jgi:hypothetical protein
MNEFIDFIRMVNQRMHENGTARFESILMPANFSSIVGEFMSTGIPKHCASIARPAQTSSATPQRHDYEGVAPSCAGCLSSASNAYNGQLSPSVKRGRPLSPAAM